jgi:hypothetical protein
MKNISTLVPHALALFITIVFVDSLRFKFSNHPNTETIFSILNEWAGTLGFTGLFADNGLFSAYVIGSVELLASTLLIVGIWKSTRVLQAWGALLALCVMTGALFFHLFTPLGIDPNNDGGGLFVTAVLVWFGSAILLYVRRNVVLNFFKKK